MCARYPTPLDEAALLEQFRLGSVPDYKPQVNVAPTDAAPVIIVHDGKQELRYMKWGLLPHWAKDSKVAARMINARLETVFEKPAYSPYIKRNRCLVPALGFFEWDENKTPFLVRLKNGRLMGFAGIWNRWHDPVEPNRVIETYSIITTGASPLVRDIHDRMPAILPAESYAAWLDRDVSDPGQIRSLLCSLADDEIELITQNRSLNNSHRKDVALRI